MRIAVPLAMLAFLGAPIARADDKHPVVVLGIVADSAGAKSADAITAVVRAEAAAKTSEYKVVGAPDKIEAAQLAAECDRAQPECAARLAAGFAAEYAITGALERRGTHQDLVLSLVDVKAKRRMRSVHQTAASDADVKKLARTAYTRLVTAELGGIAIVANAERGEVLIDGQVVAGLFEGRTTLTGLVKGTHLLAIRAAGYKPFEVEITIDKDGRQMFLLEPE